MAIPFSITTMNAISVIMSPTVLIAQLPMFVESAQKDIHSSMDNASSAVMSLSAKN